MIFILYGSVVVFAIFLAALVLVKLRTPETRRPSPLRDEQLKSPTIDPPREIRPLPEERPPAVADTGFDPEATQLYMAGPLPAEPRTREGAVLAGAVLLGLSGSQKGRSFPVPGKGLTIGRDPANDVVLADPRVSARHAWIGFVNGRAVLRDLESTNGTFLNAGATSTVGDVGLRPDDTIFFGGHHGEQFRFIALE